MGAFKSLMDEAREDLTKRFRDVGMDREPSDAEVLERMLELTKEVFQKLEDEKNGKTISVQHTEN